MHETLEELKKTGIQVISEPSEGSIRDLAILGSGPRWQPF
ncbi:hypothetical protein [Lactobacillus amylolyticus]